MHPRRKTSLVIQFVGNEVLVHDADRGKVHVLNATAGDVLELCDGTRTIADLTLALSESTGIDASIIEPDVVSIVGAFHELGLFDPATLLDTPPSAHG